MRCNGPEGGVDASPSLVAFDRPPLLARSLARSGGTSPAEAEDQDEVDLAPGVNEDALDDEDLDTDTVTSGEPSPPGPA